MSKASEWMKGGPFQRLDIGDFSAWVSSSIGPEPHETLVLDMSGTDPEGGPVLLVSMSAADSMRLARWILDVFDGGQDRPA